MIKIGILGDIGAGKSYIAKNFGYPVFNADLEVSKIYNSNRSVFKQIKKDLPNYFSSFPIKKTEMMKAILDKSSNLKKIIKIIHPTIRKKLNIFLKKNKNKKFVILDIPLLLENNINNKNDILIFVQAKHKKIYQRLKKRKNFNLNLIRKFKKIQLPLEIKKKKSSFIIKNNFTNKNLKKDIKLILKKIKND